MLVCTVAANLKDCPPFASLHGRALKPQEQADWDAKVKAGAELAEAGKHELALKEFEAASKMDGKFAELQYRIGLSQQALGRIGDARKSFQLALDLDALRFRVDSKLNSIIRETIKGRTNEGIFFLDAETAIRDGETLPGKEFFWEHVHFNFAGNYRLARGLSMNNLRMWLFLEVAS